VRIFLHYAVAVRTGVVSGAAVGSGAAGAGVVTVLEGAGEDAI
jgi:hypothetical protein